jgi:hypothetical protein
VSKSIWMIVVMGLGSALALTLAMMFSLDQFKAGAAAEWVKLAELTTNEFKFTNVAVRVNLHSNPPAMKISYDTEADSKFNLSVQNAEMEKVGEFALRNYKGRELNIVSQVDVTRSESHGSGCFRQTYVSSLSVPNPRRNGVPGANPFGTPPAVPPRDR